MNRNRLFAVVVAAAAVVVALLPSPASAQVTGGPYSYYALTPCRAVDTRSGYGGVLNGSPSTRDFTIQTVCGVPSGAKAVTLNVTIVNPTGLSGGSFLTLWPTGGTKPWVSTINFTNTDTALANGAIVPLAASVPDLSVYFGGPGQVDLLLDVTGYFQ